MSTRKFSLSKVRSFLKKRSNTDDTLYENAWDIVEDQIQQNQNHEDGLNHEIQNNWIQGEEVQDNEKNIENSDLFEEEDYLIHILLLLAFEC